VGWCVICSELPTKSTNVVDTRVFGRHGMMSGSSGACWVSEVLQNLPKLLIYLPKRSPGLHGPK
jgi:hypothetical protein